MIAHEPHMNHAIALITTGAPRRNEGGQNLDALLDVNDLIDSKSRMAVVVTVSVSFFYCGWGHTYVCVRVCLVCVCVCVCGFYKSMLSCRVQKTIKHNSGVYSIKFVGYS